MPNFKGFAGTAKKNIQLPPELIGDVLPNLTDLDEIKLILIFFWYLQNRDQNTGYVTVEELLLEPLVKTTFASSDLTASQKLHEAIDKAVLDKVVLRGQKDGVDYLFINSPRGTALLEGLQAGEWQATVALPLAEARPNIFSLYEQNIGLLTPLMADTLMDAEKSYPLEWIEEAMKIAVERNARNWRYIDAILSKWKEKGRDEENQRSAAEGRKRDSEGEFSDFIHH